MHRALHRPPLVLASCFRVLIAGTGDHASARLVIPDCGSASDRRRRGRRRGAASTNGARALGSPSRLASVRSAGLQLLGSLRVLADASRDGVRDASSGFPTVAAPCAAFFRIAGDRASSFFWFSPARASAISATTSSTPASVVSGYSASMVFLQPARWWQAPGDPVGAASPSPDLCLLVAWRWRRDMSAPSRPRGDGWRRHLPHLQARGRA